MLLSIMLENTNAALIKSLSKKMSIETVPDLYWEYYLHDATSTSASTYKSKYGVYKNTRNFSQNILVGKEIGTTAKDTEYVGKNVIYQIKIPVSEAGYYNLNFTVDFICDGDATKEMFSYKQQYAVGCEVISEGQLTNVGFGKNTAFRLESRELHGSSYAAYNTLSVNDKYHWKTLCPTRKETVSLTFRATQSEVDNYGYVIWMWDFHGLTGPHTYTVNFTDVSVEKTMNIDGTAPGRTKCLPMVFIIYRKSIISRIRRTV